MAFLYTSLQIFRHGGSDPISDRFHPGYSWTLSSALTHEDRVSRIKEDLDKKSAANELISRVIQFLTLRERPVHMKVQPSRESDGRTKGSDGSPLFARIIGREQELESSLSSCRGRAEVRLREAREEADAIRAKRLEEAGGEARRLLEEAEKKALQEADGIKKQSSSDAEAILRYGRSRRDELLQNLLPLILPGGSGEDMP
jgi:vacuolar-type H+-ATPase subunit H